MRAIMTIDEIRDNFELLEEWDDRYRYVIELGRTLEPLTEDEHGREQSAWLRQPGVVVKQIDHSRTASRRSSIAATATPISCAAWSRSCWRFIPAARQRKSWQPMRSPCSTSSVSASI